MTPTTLYQLDIEFDGTPRSLSQIASILDKVNIQILASASQHLPQATTTTWRITADLAPSPYGLRELHTTLLQLPEIFSVSIAAIARGRLHL